MFLRIRRRFTYTNVVLTLALVFAMSGGAYAANRYVITSTKQISPKVLKALQGKSGVSGAPGAAGPAGPQGPSGGKGENGANGASGVSVTSTESKAKIGSCKEGGSEFKSAGGTTYACNGEKGKEGKEGAAFPVGGVLPEGKTLTGVWASSGYGEAKALEPGFGRVATGVSFALPYALGASAGPAAHFIKERETPPSECPGTTAAPAAAPGNLCVFVESAINVGDGGAYPGINSSDTGFTIVGYSEAKGPMLLDGSWAVTAAE